MPSANLPKFMAYVESSQIGSVSMNVVCSLRKWVKIKWWTKVKGERRQPQNTETYIHVVLWASYMNDSLILKLDRSECRIGC